jgi:hypothetical protein
VSAFKVTIYGSCSPAQHGREFNSHQILNPVINIMNDLLEFLGGGYKLVGSTFVRAEYSDKDSKHWISER